VLVVLGDHRGQRGDIHLRIVKWGQHRPDGGRFDGGQVALHIDDGLDLARAINGLQSLENPVGAGRMVGAGHDGLAAMGGHGARNFRGVGGDHNPADLRFGGPAQHMDDHRQAADVQQRLSRQAGGGHTGGNQHQGAGFCHGVAGGRKWPKW